MIYELEAEAIIDAFNRFTLNYVIIGAFAAIAQNVPVPPTMDIDFYAASDRRNLERLSDALVYLDARIRVSDLDEGITFDRSPQFLEKLQMLNLTCAFGEFDVLFRPVESKTFKNWRRGPFRCSWEGLRLRWRQWRILHGQNVRRVGSKI